MTTKIKLASNVSDVDLTTTAPTNGQGLIYNSTSSKWVPGAAGGGVTVYATIDDLPLSGVDTGALALVDSTNKLYLWMDTGWYNIATINTNPSITGGNNTPYLLATDGTPTEITLIASDPEGIPLTWSYEVTAGSLTNGGGTTATVSNVDNVFTVTPTTTEAYAGAFSLTFKASDGVNLGTTVAAFTLAFRIPDSNYTTLLAKGTTASQNSTFVDSSTNAHTITANGDVYQGTFSPYRAGGYSMYFDGTGDYLTAAYGADLSLDADFTIECWFYPIAKTSNFPTLINNYSSYAANGGFAIFAGHDGGTAGKYNVAFNGSFPVISSTDSIAYGQWQHVALVRSGTTLTLYLDGIANGSSTQSATVIGTSNYWWIGAAGDGLANSGLNGNISNLRVVKGTAVYTSNFTPPTGPLTAITNTSLLINTPYIADSSSNGHAITVNGNTSTKPFSPFDHEVYATATNGGSAYFDGTGDYIQVGTTHAALSWLDSAGATGTIEAFVYPTAFRAQGASVWIFPSVISNGATYSNFGVVSGYPRFYWYNGSAQQLNSTIAVNLNAWNHIAVVFASNTVTVYVNGVSGGSTAFDNVAWSSGSSGDLINVGAELFGTTTSAWPGHISNVRVVNGTAVYTSNFTPPTAPLTAITNTSLLLNFTNAGIQDYSQVSDLKLVGNATGSSTQTKYASYSMYFDGTGDYLLGGDITLGAADFTIECWWYTGSTSRQAILHGSNGYDHSYAIDYNSRGNYTMGIWASSTGSSWNLANADAGGNGIGSATIAQNTWTHIAFVRNGTVLRLYVNGTLDVEITGVSAAVATRPSNQPIIGMWFNGTQYANSGYIEDLRITKGLARYPTNPFPTDQLLG